MDEQSEVVIPACAVQNVQTDGTCSAVVWIEKPTPVLPPLTLAEGAEISFAIGSVWALAVVYRLMRRASSNERIF